MRGVNTENSGVWAMEALMAAQGQLGVQPLGMEQIAVMAGHAEAIAEPFFVDLGMLKRVARSDRDKSFAYYSIALFGRMPQAAELGADVPSVIEQALRNLRADLSSKSKAEKRSPSATRPPVRNRIGLCSSSNRRNLHAVHLGPIPTLQYGPHPLQARVGGRRESQKPNH